MSKKIQDAILITENAKRGINKLFLNTELANSLLEINSTYDRVLTRLKFMGGTLESESDTKAKPAFPPMTDFMGEKIEVDKRTTAADLNPSEDRKQRHLAKVDKLYAEIGNYDAATILNSYQTDEDKLALRHVAKRAGVTDYETRELNADLIEEILVGIEIKEAEKSQQQKIDKKLAHDKIPEIVLIPDVVLTKEMIDKDRLLKELGAKPGDIQVTDSAGRRSLKKELPVKK